MVIGVSCILIFLVSRVAFADNVTKHKVVKHVLKKEPFGSILGQHVQKSCGWSSQSPRCDSADICAALRWDGSQFSDERSFWLNAKLTTKWAERMQVNGTAHWCVSLLEIARMITALGCENVKRNVLCEASDLHSVLMDTSTVDKGFTPQMNCIRRSCQLPLLPSDREVDTLLSSFEIKDDEEVSLAMAAAYRGHHTIPKSGSGQWFSWAPSISLPRNTVVVASCCAVSALFLVLWTLLGKVVVLEQASPPHRHQYDDEEVECLLAC